MLRLQNSTGNSSKWSVVITRKAWLSGGNDESCSQVVEGRNVPTKLTAVCLTEVSVQSCIRMIIIAVGRIWRANRQLDKLKRDVFSQTYCYRPPEQLSQGKKTPWHFNSVVLISLLYVISLCLVSFNSFLLLQPNMHCAEL